MGYKQEDGVYCHPTRRVIFLGDLIDRRSDQCGVIGIVRSMIEQGLALLVMGNHEFNANAYYTKDSERGEYLRLHSDKNREQHQAFLDAYADDPEAYREVIDWFRTLPLWLEFDGLRVIHACWDPEWIERVAEVTGPQAVADR